MESEDGRKHRYRPCCGRRDPRQDSGGRLPTGGRIYHVVDARDGVEAIAILEVRDDVSAVFTDVAMPNMNGIQLAKIVSQQWPHIGIVVTSGALPPGVALDLPPGARFVA